MGRTGDDTRRRLAAGAVLGTGAWLVGYLLVYLVTADRLRESGLRRIVELFGGDLPTWKMVGWVVYNAQFVDVVVEGPFGGDVHFVGGEDGVTPLLYLVAPLLLLAAGALAVWLADADDEPARAAVTGAGVVLGYGVLSVAGIVLFATDDPAVAPEALPAVLLSGLAYPIVLGAAGGAAATLATRDGRPEPTTRRL